MVLDGQKRADKYAAKYDPTVVSARYTATKDAAELAAGGHQIAMGALALQVRSYLNAAGILPINSVRFIGFANKLYSISNKVSGLAATNQATLKAKAWVDEIEATADDKVVLTQIWNYFTGTLGTCPSPFPSN